MPPDSPPLTSSVRGGDQNYSRQSVLQERRRFSNKTDAGGPDEPSSEMRACGKYFAGEPAENIVCDGHSAGNISRAKGHSAEEANFAGATQRKRDGTQRKTAPCALHFLPVLSVSSPDTSGPSSGTLQGADVISRPPPEQRPFVSCVENFAEGGLITDQPETLRSTGNSGMTPKTTLCAEDVGAGGGGAASPSAVPGSSAPSRPPNPHYLHGLPTPESWRQQGQQQSGTQQRELQRTLTVSSSGGGAPGSGPSAAWDAAHGAKKGVSRLSFFALGGGVSSPGGVSVSTGGRQGNFSTTTFSAVQHSAGQNILVPAGQNSISNYPLPREIISNSNNDNYPQQQPLPFPPLATPVHALQRRGSAHFGSCGAPHNTGSARSRTSVSRRHSLVRPESSITRGRLSSHGGVLFQPSGSGGGASQQDHHSSKGGLAAGASATPFLQRAASRTLGIAAPRRRESMCSVVSGVNMELRCLDGFMTPIDRRTVAEKIKYISICLIK